MELHSPPNLKLPALKYIKKTARELVENDPRVQNLIRSNLLLDYDLNELFCKIKELTEEINKILEIAKESLKKTDLDYHLLHSSPHRYSSPVTPYQSRIRVSSRGAYTFRLIRKLRHATKEQRIEIEKELKEKLEKERKDYNLKIRRKLREKSNKVNNLMDSFETKKKIALDILVGHPVYFCKKCKSLISIDRFHSVDCICGEKINFINKTENIIIHRFNPGTISFINDNLWLEHGIDYLLRKKNFQTMCGVYLLGHSGVEHEIDNIAENTKESIRIFCECKTGSISVADVFIFSGKMLDIGCSRGYIFTNSSDVKREIKQLARSKNISIVESVLKKPEKKLINEIRE
ncbi:restriction endonuclease [Candidatus Parcubacteria bacterium]|nr:restriction endonuclease [Candidatus Parcubacteria bacterium]